MYFITKDDFLKDKLPMYYVDVEVSIRTDKRDKNGKIIFIKRNFNKIITKGDEEEANRRLRLKIDKILIGKGKKKSYEITNITLLRNLGWGVKE